MLALMVMTYNAFGQHTVTLTTPNGQTLTISGDSTKHSFKANLARYKGQYKDAAEHKLKGIENGESRNKGASYYDVACYYSQAKDLENGFRYLKESIKLGFNDIAHMLFDKDLVFLRADASWKKELKKPIKAYFKNNNEELANMFGVDQAERLSGKPIDWDVLRVEDRKRRDRVQVLLKKGKVKSADDYYKVAFIMHHGEEVDDYKKAHDLALKAFSFEKKHNMSPWLAAATKDRYLLKAGKPQWFGTQGMEFLQKTSKMGINPEKIDITAVDDDQRKAWNAPSLETIKTYLKNYEEEQALKNKADKK